MLTTREVAVRFGVQPVTVRAWVARGKFPPPDYRPHSRMAYWKVETVEKWIERNR